MEEFVMDVLTFVGLEVSESGASIDNAKNPKEMTAEELEEYHATLGFHEAASEIMEFLLKRYQMFCEKNAMVEK